MYHLENIQILIREKISSLVLRKLLIKKLLKGEEMDYGKMNTSATLIVLNAFLLGTKLFDKNLSINNEATIRAIEDQLKKASCAETELKKVFYVSSAIGIITKKLGEEKAAILIVEKK